MRAKLRRLAISLLTILLIIMSMPISAFADTGIGDNNNTGGGSGSYSSGKGFTWTDNQSGYRFAIVDKDFNQVSNTVDLLFSVPWQVTNENNRYTNSRAGTLSVDNNNYIRRTFDQILANEEFTGAPYPPTPIRCYVLNGENVSEAQGDKFKKWFLNGESISNNYNAPRTSVSYNSNPRLTSDIRSQVDDVAQYSVSSIDYWTEYYSGHYDFDTSKTSTGGWTNDGKAYEVETSSITEEKEPGFLESVVNGAKNVIDNVWNFIKGIFGGNKSSSLDNYNGQTYAFSTSNSLNSTIISFEELEQIPLASTREGYAKNILNARENGQFLFHLPGTDVNDESKWVAEVMIENNYSVIVEPIFWFIPAAWSGGVASPIHPNYVYGTVANIIEFNANQGYKFGSTGGAYSKLLSNLGWRCMYLGKNWPDTEPVISPPSRKSGVQSLSELLRMINSNEGVAMHIYITSDIVNDTTPEPDVPDIHSVTNTNDLIIEQSEISKYLSTKTSTVPNWAPASFTFNYASMAGSDEHYCSDEDCSGHSCTAKFGDSVFKYIIENSAAINDKIEANSAGGVFESKMINNTKSGNASLGGGSNTLSTAEYQTVIWRGLDVPTIASYKESPSIELRALLGKYGKTPAGSRGKNGFYTLDFLAKLDPSSLSDLETHSVHSYNGSTWHTSTHVASPSDISYKGTVLVGIYRGLNDKTIGNETKTNEIQTVTPFGNVTSINSAGYMHQETTPIQFYPYVRMTYQTTGSNVKHDVNVLSQFYSELLPNSFAEAAWINGNENESLAMSSTQWSLHSKAVNGDKPWNGTNKVLPGGAIFQLSTGSTPSKIALVTWQPIVEPDVRNMLYNTLPSNEYTVSKANAEHKLFIDQGKIVLENLRLVQWVNADANATNVWSGQAVKITGGGESLSVLGLSGTTSSEAKYHLKGDSAADAANEGDLDIIKTTDSNDVYFKVFADTSGNVYLAKSIGAIEPLRTINGTNLNAPASVTVTKILSKNDTVADIDNKLTGDAKELNQRTLLITNLVKTLERNRGNDPSASWAPDGKWYSEAFDGIVVVRKCSIFDIGFNKPGLRTAVLDPRICPPSSGQSDMFSRFFSSRFMVDSKSTASIAQNKPNHWIGTFKNKDIYLPNMEKLYMSKVFYVPNVNTQDLR